LPYIPGRYPCIGVESISFGFAVCRLEDSCPKHYQPPTSLIPPGVVMGCEAKLLLTQMTTPQHQYDDTVNVLNP